jgi:hypothetical protein
MIQPGLRLVNPPNLSQPRVYEARTGVLGRLSLVREFTRPAGAKECAPCTTERPGSTSHLLDYTLLSIVCRASTVIVTCKNLRSDTARRTPGFDTGPSSLVRTPSLSARSNTTSIGNFVERLQQCSISAAWLSSAQAIQRVLLSRITPVRGTGVVLASQ